MSVSLRSHLATGVAAVATAALVVSPTTVSAHPSMQASERAVTARVDLAASVKPIVLEPLRPEQAAVARDAISRIVPDSTFAAAAAAPAPLNAASDWVVGAYQWLQYWVSYGVDLADYVLGFIPFGYFIGDQINIFYDFLITPIADSVVYGLVVPVLNDPLNISTWVDGLVNVGQTAITAAINTGIVEFNYFFGWLIPPLPPLPIPPFPLATVQTVEPLETVEEQASRLLSATLAEKVDVEGDTTEVEVTDAEASDTEVVDAKVTEPEVTEVDTVTVDPEVVTPELPVTEPEVVADPETEVDENTVDPTDATDATAPEQDDETVDPTTPTKLTPIKSTPTKSTTGTVSAQGEVRGGGGATTPNTDTKPAADTTSGKDKPAPAVTPTAPHAGADKTKTDTSDATADAGKAEKKDAASD
jgi:hypothetical protein